MIIHYLYKTYIEYCWKNVLINNVNQIKYWQQLISYFSLTQIYSINFNSNFKSLSIFSKKSNSSKFIKMLN
jgi:hypothetical protein